MLPLILIPLMEAATTFIIPAAEGYLYRVAIVETTSIMGVSAVTAVEGFGITTNIATRLATHKRNIEASGKVMKIIQVQKMPIKKARELETNIKRQIKADGTAVNTGISGFKTEAHTMPWYRQLQYNVKDNMSDVYRYWSK